MTDWMSVDAKNGKASVRTNVASNSAQTMEEHDGGERIQCSM